MNYSNKNLLQDLFVWLKPYKRNFFIGSLLRITSDAIWLFPAWALAEIITFLTGYTSGDSLEYFWILTAGIWISLFYHFITHDLAKYYIFPVGEKMRLDLYKKGLAHLFLLDKDWHEKENSGNKIQKINKAGESVDQIARMYVEMFIESIVNIVGMTLILFTVEKWIAVTLVIFFVSFYFLNRFMMKRPSKATYIANTEWEQFDGVIFESVNNISTVQALGLSKNILKWVEFRSKRLFETIKSRIFWFRTRSVVLNLYQSIFTNAVTFFAMWQIIQGNLEIGVIVLVLFYFRKISDSANEFSEITYKFELSRVGLMRFKDMMDAEPSAEISGTKKFPTNWKVLEFKNLNFSFHGRSILKNFNLKIKRGEKIGVVGISGTGKSTLFKLLLKSYDRYEGEILFDGIELKDIKRASYIPHFAYVPQETELFNLSLKENVNLAIGSKGDEKQFKRSIKIAHVKDFLNKLPNGVDSLIGEKGVKLSGGERQRIGIARAIYKNPELLLMDEATSHLDAESEFKIQSALSDVFKNISAIVIAHRLSTLKEMNRIILMSKGQIIEDGTFKSLIAKKGAFYKLWKRQKF